LLFEFSELTISSEPVGGIVAVLDFRNEKRTLFSLCSLREGAMLKIFVEEAAALASITLFVGMIAIWAQVIIPQL
jgi:hypothetical protein